MINKRKRRPLTEEDFFKKEHYLNILYLIGRYEITEKLELKHLVYALVEKHNLSTDKINDIETFFKPEHAKEIREHFKGLDKETMKLLDKQLRQNELEFLYEYGLLSKENKFPTQKALTDALFKLKKFGIIETVKKNKKYRYYRFTLKGFREFDRKVSIPMLIDRCSDEKISELKKIIGDFLTNK